LYSDFRDTFRSLIRDRAFALGTVFLLALTIGGTAGIFATVYAVILRPSPIAAPERIVVAWQRDTSRNASVIEVALGEAERWRRDATSFAEVGVFSSVNWPLTIIEGDQRLRIAYAAVSPSFFAIVGTRPELGRVLDQNDEAVGEPQRAVISHRFWRTSFGDDPTIVGRTIRIQSDIEGQTGTVEIVGVMPAAFDFPRGAMLWLPARPAVRAATPAGADRQRYVDELRVFYVLARLRDGTSAIAAQAQLGSVLRSVRMDHSTATLSAVVTPVDDFVLGPVKPVLWIMFASGCLMLLLACASVSGLHVFRFAAHDRMLAIQLALGASKRRLIRRSFIETAWLASAAAMASVVIASVITRALILATPVDVPRLKTATIATSSVLALIASFAAIATVLTGIWPVLFINHVDPGRTLTSGAKTAMHPHERALQRIVVGWQVAVAVVLLTGAALFVRSIQRLDGMALGFVGDGLVSVNVEPSFQDLARWDQFYEALLARTARLPHVRSAAAVYLRPLSGPIGDDTIPVFEGQQGASGEDAPWRSNALANLETVTPGYFQTLGTRLVAGRDFTSEDRDTSPNVVIMSASAARRYFQGRDAIGQRIVVPSQRTPGTIDNPRWQTVVGVVEDVRYRGITDPRLDLYLPAKQSKNRVKYVMARTNGDSGPVLAGIRTAAQELAPTVYVGDTSVMTDVVARETGPWRFAMRLLAGFGITAATLAALGLVGLVSLAVSLRQRELGIRAALGATPNRLRLHVLADGLISSAAGALVGLLVALVLGRVIGHFLVETSPRDPVAFIGAVALMIGVGTVACLIPAQRAATRDPAEALRAT
jgi:predicted permease